MTRLVTVAHGTRQVAGNAVARSITAAAGERLGLPAVATYVELCEPSFAEVVTCSAEPTVVVPLLLSTGFHLRQDLPRMSGASGVDAGPVTVGRALGPHHLLAQAQVARLVEAGAWPGSARLVLVAAGSSDPLATRDLVRAAELLGREWGAPVEVATLTALGRRPADVVRPGDAVSPYLLAPGFFADRARRESLAAGATIIADVIGPHRCVVDLVVQRAQALASVRLSAWARPA